MTVEISNARFFDPLFRPVFLKLILLSLLLVPASAFPAQDADKNAAKNARQKVKDAKKLTKRGDFAGAEQVLRPLVGANQSNTTANSEAVLALASVLIKKRALVEAFDLSHEIAVKEPKNAYAHAVLGTVLLTAGNFTAARASLTTALALDHTQSLAWAEYGLLNFYQNRIAASLDALDEAIYYNPNEPDFVYAYAQVAARAEKYKAAAAAYKKYLEISDESDQEKRERIKGLVKFFEYLGNQEILYTLSGKDQTSVGINLVSNRPVLSVRVNKSEQPLQFVLDTGSNICVISDRAAERLKIKPITRGGSAVGIGGDGKFEIVYGFLRSIEIGETRVKNVPVYIRKFHQINESIDGYIGLSLISKFLTTIDYGKLTFSLIKKSKIKISDDENSEFSQPLHLTPSGFLSGEVKIRGIEAPLNFIVDTGASVSVVSNDLAETREFSGMAAGEKINVVGSAGVSRDIPSFMLPSISFGKNSSEKIVAVSLDLDLINQSAGFEQSGILGGNFLKNYRLIFDFENSKVTFVPNDGKIRN